MSTAEPYLALNGVEIANTLRTMMYLWRGLGGSAWSVDVTANITEVIVVDDPYSDTYSDTYGGKTQVVIAKDLRNLCSYCAALDTGDDHTFVSPAEDGAPWYSPSRPESGDFLGLLPQVTLLPVMQRTVTKRALGGGTIGPAIANPRIVQVAGVMVAASEAGMAYGQSWLRRALSGSPNGCGGDTLEVVPYCAEPRILKGVGVVDGPLFTPAMNDGTGACLVQTVAFQLAAGEPYLREVTTVFGSTAFNGSVQWFTLDASAPVVAEAAAIIVIRAGGSTLDHVVVAYGGFQWAVNELPPYAVMTVDASLRTVDVVDAAGNELGGLDYTTFDGLWQWATAPAGGYQAVGIYSDIASGTGGATFAVSAVSMEL